MDDLLKNNEEYLEETCSVCGRRLTKYGNKQLKDGVLCRTCAIFSSPFLRDEDFAERTVEDMKKHLDYRRENAHRLESFKKGVTVEGRYTLCVDEENRNMIFSKKQDLLKENPDIISLDSIREMSVVEEQYLKEDSETISVSFNGKTRFTLDLPTDISREDAEKAALQAEATPKYLEGKQVVKVIVVPHRIINIVIK